MLHFQSNRVGSCVRQWDLKEQDDVKTLVIFGRIDKEVHFGCTLSFGFGETTIVVYDAPHTENYAV